MNLINLIKFMNLVNLQSVIIFVAFLFHLVCGYSTFYVIESCENGHLDINMHSSGKNSSGILKASHIDMQANNFYCEIILYPPLAYGVVISIRLINLPKVVPKDNDEDCDNYLEIHTKEKESTKLCGYSDDEREYKSFETWKPMKLTFNITNKIDRNHNHSLQFETTFTAARQATLLCSKDEYMCSNNRCIWSGLTCDGHNNCGDLSDETSAAKCGNKSLTAKESVGIIVASIAICLVFVIIIAYLRRQRSNRHNSVSPRSSLRIRARNAISFLVPGGPPPKYEDIQNTDYNSVDIQSNNSNIPSTSSSVTSPINQQR